MKQNALWAAEEFLQEVCQDNECLLAAVSGGLDSMCLLHFLQNRTLTHGGKIYAAHFNHHLRGDAASRDADFVREYCRTNAIDLLYGEADVGDWAAQKSLGIETAARELRYRFLYAAREQSGCRYILTAHHANDNAETILYNWIRGTGSRGLSGIPVISDLSEQESDGKKNESNSNDSHNNSHGREGKILRPFLRLTRAELESYAREYHIPHIEDETNADPNVTPRNFIRRDILPLLEKINPQAIRHITQTAVLLSEDSEALEESGRQAVAMSEYTASASVSLAGDAASERMINREKFSRWPRAVQARGLLQVLAEIAGQRKDFTEKHIHAVLSLPAGGILSLPYRIQVRREKQVLIFQRLKPAVSQTQTGQIPCASDTCSVNIQPGQTVALGEWFISLAVLPRQDSPVYPDILNAEQYQEEYIYILKIPDKTRMSVSYWRRDDRMTLPGSKGARSFKRLCVDYKIPIWIRDILPVFRIEEHPAAAPRIGAERNFTVENSQMNFMEMSGKPVRFYQLLFIREAKR